MYARSLALLPDCHSSSSIFAPRYCAPGEWVALAPSSGQQEVCHIGLEPETSRPQTGLLLTRLSLYSHVALPWSAAD